MYIPSLPPSASFSSSLSYYFPIASRNLATSALSAATSLRKPACAARNAAASSCPARHGGVVGVSQGGVSVSMRCCCGGGEAGRRSVVGGVKNSWVREGELAGGEGGLSECGGDLNVLLAMRGRGLRWKGERRWGRTGEGLGGDEDWEKRSGAIEIPSRLVGDLMGEGVRRIVPGSSSEPESESVAAASGDGIGDSGAVLFGSIEGADMSPTQLRDMIGPSTSISRTRRPRMLKMETLPASVPTVMSVSGASYPWSSPSNALPPNPLRLRFDPSATTARHVAGPETCYVRNTLPPPSKSTSRHRPSWLMLTMRDL
jgi:hypothetical protein